MPLLLKIGVCCARTIVEGHGGRIWAESTLGDGAVFHVELPATERIAAHAIDLPVVFLTGHADVPTSVKAMKAGAVDFLEKPVDRDLLLGALARALARDKHDRDARGHSEYLRARFALLTPREREVFDRVVSGKANKVIADELGIAERTVKVHRAQLMAKLGARSPAELGGLAEQLHRLSA